MRKHFLLTACCALLVATSVFVTAQENRPRGGQGGPTAQQQGPVKATGAIDLFASKNLADWDYFLEDSNVKKEDVWSFNEAGNLFCKGKPMGYLCTKQNYRDFKLTVQWRWPEGVEPTNSGVLMRINGEPKALPRCVEAQLQHKNAGDIWAFHGFELDAHDNARFQKIANNELGGKMQGITKLVDAERPAGRWNTFEILCQDETLVISVNGTIVNWTEDVGDVTGKIGLQSEGGPIEFRNFIVTPLYRTDD